MFLGSGSLIQGCELSNYLLLRGPTSFLHCPLLGIQTQFSGSLVEILQAIFHKVVRTAISDTISDFLLIQLHHISKMDDVSK